MAVEPASLLRPLGALSSWWQRAALAVHVRTAHLPPTTRAMLWAMAAGSLFSLLNALMRALALTIDPFQAQFLRYFFGLIVLLPIVWHRGLAAYRPRHIGGQFVRGAAHTIGLCLWFTALPQDSAGRHDGDRFHRADLHHDRRQAGIQRADALGALAGHAGRLGRRADRGRPQAVGQRRRVSPHHAGLGAGVRGVVPDHQGADALRDHRHDPGVAVDQRGR